ncbi:MAG: alpha/beta fold hydrolase [Pseudomonadota bacterium]
MFVFFSILLWVAATLVFLTFAFRRFFQRDIAPDSIVFVQTEDGWRLGLHRYEPQKTQHGLPPILLCPGLAMNSAIFEFGESSFARFFSEQGYDTWVLNLRGRGSSQQPRLFGAYGNNWSFDDYVEFDVPAALSEICCRTGASQVQLVGFGMGASVIHALLQGPVAPVVRSFVSLAGGVFFGRGRNGAGLTPGTLRFWKWLPLDLLVWISSPLLGRFFPSALGLFQNKDNIDPAKFRRAIANSIVNPSKREMVQLANWIEKNSFESETRERDYKQGTAKIRTPTMWLVGPHDQISPLPNIRATYEMLDGVTDRKLVMAGRVQGMSSNYGHLDLLLGRNAHRDIFPCVLKWLDDHAGVSLPEDRPSAPASVLMNWSKKEDSL